MEDEKIYQEELSIALFMGHSKSKVDGYIQLSSKEGDRYSTSLSSMGYRENWNSLMSVVEKIESLESPTGGHWGVFISSNSCTIQDTELHLAIAGKIDFAYLDEVILKTKLEATYKAVVNFIEWYNKQK